MPAGDWGELRCFAQAPAGGDFVYQCAFLDKPDAFRGFYIEQFTGSQAYSRPFRAHSIAESSFTENLWHEPVPFNLASDYGLAIAHHGDYCWLSSPNSVWRASLVEQSLELTADVLSLKQESNGMEAKLTAELRNDDGSFASLPAPLDIGCRLDFSPGYVTTTGSESSPGQSFYLEAYEHTSAGGKASLVLNAIGGWERLQNWVCRHQLRWNKDSQETSIRDILAFVLARAGLKLEAISQSDTITSFYPDFSINPGARGNAVVNRLLSCVPDVIFFEGDKAFLLHPQPEDEPVYSYACPQEGSIHPILEGRYRLAALESNRVQVEGYDSVSQSAIISHSFNWDEINKLYDRFTALEDSNIGSVSQAQARGEAYLRKAEMQSAGGLIRIPVNCGQQPCDVISISDSRAGLDSQNRRVLGLSLVYNPEHGKYEQRLILGAV